MSRQSRLDWFLSITPTQRRRAARRAQPYRRALRIEPLEDRRLLAILVDTLDDENDGSGVGGTSLREAIAEATPGETIDFAVNGTITLEHGELLIDKELTITGPGANLLTIDADGASRVFRVDGAVGSATVTISGLTMTGGSALDGGAVSSAENLTIATSTISGNTATHSGGGVFTQSGNLTILDSTLSGNAAQYGGGLYVATTLGFTATITNSTISGNTATDGGGGIYNFLGHLVIEHSTITDNEAEPNRGGGIVSWGDQDVTLTEIYSSIIAGNRSNDEMFPGSDVDLIGGPIGGPFDTIDSLGYNLVGTGNATSEFDATGDLPPGLDPLIEPLGDYGGPTPTHRLLAASPALDAGDPDAEAGMLGIPDYDQRGALLTRVFDGNFDAVAVIDIGAYENDAVVFVVDTLDDNDDADYTAGQFSLREAIYEASLVVGETPIIVFDPSIHGGTIVLTLPGELVISSSLTIQGPGAGLMTIDGNDLSPGVPTATGKRVFVVDDAEAENLIDVVLGRLTITGGDSYAGGAVFNQERLTIASSVLTGNAGVWGGAVYNAQDGDLTVESSTISGNVATSSGGGLYNYGGTAAVLNSLISENDAPEGAGIHNVAGASLELVGSEVSANVALNVGGGILNSGDDVTIEESTVSGNDALRGAGMFNDIGLLIVARSTISGNTATDAGGGIFNNFAELQITDSTIDNNSAGTYGGGLYLAGDLAATTTITNSTISGNSATAAGGGMYNFQGTALISHSTITANETPADSGGGIASWADSLTASTTVYSTIIAGNIGGDVLTGEGISNSFVSGGYNLIGSGDGSTAFVEAGDQTGEVDPMLGPLVDNGGPTFTHALLSGSPAIDAGEPLAEAGENDVPLYDQRGAGFDRVRDGDAVVGALIDIGAFEAEEFVPPEGLLGDYNENDEVDAADYTVWRDALTAGSSTLPNDPTPGTVDESDFLYWRDHFGETLMELGGGSAAGAATAVESAPPGTPRPARAELIAKSRRPAGDNLAQQSDAVTAELPKKSSAAATFTIVDFPVIARSAGPLLPTRLVRSPVTDLVAHHSDLLLADYFTTPPDAASSDEGEPNLSTLDDTTEAANDPSAVAVDAVLEEFGISGFEWH